MGQGSSIPKDEWASFCEEFSRMHHGWLVTISMVDTEELHSGAPVDSVVLANELPLEAVAVESHNHEVALVVAVGRGAARAAHPVRQPARLVLEQGPDGRHQGLRIGTENGQSMFVRFRASAAPESLDGLSTAER
jgi:hypothetical protein